MGAVCRACCNSWHRNASLQNVGLICVNEHAQAGAWDTECTLYIMQCIQPSSQNYRMPSLLLCCWSSLIRINLKFQLLRKHQKCFLSSFNQHKAVIVYARKTASLRWPPGAGPGPLDTRWFTLSLGLSGLPWPLTSGWEGVWARSWKSLLFPGSSLHLLLSGCPLRVRERWRGWGISTWTKYLCCIC